MSLKAMTAVWECLNLTSSQKLVSLYISDKVNEEHGYLFFGSKNTCIKKTGLDRHAVYKAFKELEDFGYITRHKNEKGSTVQYKFNLEKYMQLGSVESHTRVVGNPTLGSVESHTQTEVKQNKKQKPPIVPQGDVDKLVKKKKTKEALINEELKNFADIWNKGIADNLGKGVAARVSEKSVLLKQIVNQWIRNKKNSKDYMEFINALYEHANDKENDNSWIMTGKDNSKLMFQNRSRYSFYEKFHSGDYGVSSATNEDYI